MGVDVSSLSDAVFDPATIEDVLYMSTASIRVSGGDDEDKGIDKDHVCFSIHHEVRQMDVNMDGYGDCQLCDGSNNAMMGKHDGHHVHHRHLVPLAMETQIH